METLALASEYLQNRFSIFPLQPRSKKPLLISWEPYKIAYASNEQTEEWFSNSHAENNIAIVTGKISRIIAFDIDSKEASTCFDRAVESLDDEALKTALKYTLCIRTGSGNVNIVIGFRQEEFVSEDDKITNCVLWTSKNGNAKHNEIRLKGEGGYIVAPPSIHPNGNRYEIINGTVTAVPALSKTQINKLITAIRKQTSPKNDWDSPTDVENKDLNEEHVCNIVAKLKPYYQYGNRNDFTMHLSGWMRKEGISFQSAIKVVEAIAADDEEKSARIRTLEETYKKQDLHKVSGYSGLLSILVNQTQNEDDAKQILGEVGFAFPRTSDAKQLTYRAVQENGNRKAKEEQNLDSIPGRDYAEYAIKTLKKTIKQEDSLVRQICYTGLSAYANDPINLGIIAPTSEGKTYPVIESIKLFPKEDVWLIGKMSTKMLVRQKGVLVDENNEPLKPKIKELKKEFENAKKNKDKDKQEELKEQLESLSENARTMIELRGKILIFLEPPEHELWNLIKPILSHDSEEIEFPFVDKTERGFASRRIVVKGWPASIFCSAKDESNWSAWPEILSRALITSPNMNPEKYRESNLLIAQRKGLPRLIQQQVIVSDEEVGLAKLCVSNIKQQIQTNTNSSKDPVWIPFSGILAEALPAAKGPDNRITKRIFSFLEIIVLAMSHLRKKLILGSETHIIAALEDLSQVLYITQNISGMPSYKLKFFKDYLVPLVESKKKPDDKGELKENIIGVTTKELCEYYKVQTGKSITTDAMKKTYLNELLNNGYIDEEDSVIDKRQKIYRHIVDIPASIDSDPGKVSNYTNPDQFDNFMQHSNLILPKNFTNIPENWLKLEILDFLKYQIDPPRFLILDENNNELCLCKFVGEYEKHTRLIRYFSRPKFKEYHSKLFGIMKYFRQFSTEEYEKLSNHEKFVQLDNFDLHDSAQSTSKNLEGETNSMQENDNGMSSNTDNNSDHPYWTKGKWREYL